MKIKGFDYTTQQPVAHSRSEWASLFQKAAQRRVEKGETFAHDEHGALLFEAYANISTSPTDEPEWLT